MKQTALFLFLSISFLVIGCGNNDAYFQGKSPAQKKYEEAVAFESNNSNDLAAVEESYKASYEAFRFSDWGEKSRLKAAEVREKRADLALEDVLSFIRKNPDKSAEAKDKLKEVAETFKTTTIAAKALAKFEELDEEEFPELTGRIVCSLSEEDGNPMAFTAEYKGDTLPDGCLYTWEFNRKELKGTESVELKLPRAGKFRVGLTVRLRDRKLGTVESEYAVSLERLTERIEQEREGIISLVLTGKLNDAEVRAAEIDSWELIDISFTDGSMKAELNALVASVTKFYRTVLGMYDKKDKLFKLELAEEYIHQYAKSSHSKLSQRIASIEISKVEALKKSYTGLAGVFMKKKGEKMRVKGMSGTIKSVEGQTLVLDAGYGVEKQLNISEISVEELKPMLEESIQTSGRTGMGAFLEFTWDFDESRKMYNLSSAQGKEDLVNSLNLKVSLFASFEEHVAMEAEKKEQMLEAQREKLGEINTMLNEYEVYIEYDRKLIDFAVDYARLFRLPPKYKALADAHSMDLGWEFRMHYMNMGKLISKDNRKAREQLEQDFYPDDELERWLKTRDGYKKKFEKMAADVAKRKEGFDKKYEAVFHWKPEHVAFLLEKVKTEQKKNKNVMRKKGFLKKLDHYGQTLQEKLEGRIKRLLKTTIPGEYRGFYSRGIKEVYQNAAQVYDVYAMDKGLTKYSFNDPEFNKTDAGYVQVCDRINHIHRALMLQQFEYYINKGSGSDK